jgi:hypothetical protein
VSLKTTSCMPSNFYQKFPTPFQSFPHHKLSNLPTSPSKKLLFTINHSTYYQYLISREGTTAFQKWRKLSLLFFPNLLTVLYCRNLQIFSNAHVRKYFRRKKNRKRERKSHELLQNVKIMKRLKRFAQLNLHNNSNQA